MRSVFQISDRSVTWMSAAAPQTLWMRSLALLQHLAGAENGAVVLHRLLHLEAKLRRRRAAIGVAEAIEARQRELVGILGQIARGVSPGVTISAQRKPAARPNTTRSMSEFEPRRFAPCTETQAASPSAIRPGTTCVRVAVLQGQHLAVIVRRDAAHVVMDGRQNRDRLLRHVDAGEDLGAFRNARQALVQDLRIEMVEMKMDVVLLLPTPRPSRISIVMARETTSREARSFAEGA